jgi:hypothetical protein
MKKQIIWISPLFKDGSHCVILKEVQVRPVRDYYDWHLGSQTVLLSESIVLPWEIGQIMGGN